MTDAPLYSFLSVPGFLDKGGIHFGARTLAVRLLLTLPPVQAALDALVYDKAHAEAAFDLTNKNGDLAVCWMWTGSYKSMYAPLMADNNAAPKPPK
jgi:hypothetical protein